MPRPTEQTTNAQGGQDIRSYEDVWHIANLRLSTAPTSTVFYRVVPVATVLPILGNSIVLTLVPTT